MKLKISLAIKSIFIIVLLAGSVFVVSNIIIRNNFEELNYQETKKLISNLANKYVSNIKTDIDEKFNVLRTISNILETDYSSLNKEYFDKILIKTANSIDGCILAEYSYESSFVNANLGLPSGRVSNKYLKTNNNLDVITDSINVFGTDEDLYFISKTEITSLIENPYWHSFTGKFSDKVFKSELLVPLIKNEQFVGAISIEYNLEKYITLLDSLSKKNDFNIMLLSDKGTFIVHQNPEYIGSNINKIYNKLEEQFAITEKIQALKDTSFIIKGINKLDSVNYSLSTFKVSDTNTSWGIFISSSLNSMENKNLAIKKKMLNIGLVGLAVLVVVLLFFFLKLVFLITNITKVVKKLSVGNVHNIKKIHTKNNDETKDIVDYTNSVIDNLNMLTLFSENIGKGNFDYDTENMNKENNLGMAIVEMRNSLINANQEEKNRNEKEGHLNWASQGANIFNKVLRVDNQNLEDLCFKTIETLISYLDAEMGGIYLKNKKTEDYKLTASIGFSKEKYEKKTVKAGEGIVGRCILEKDTIFLNEIPKDFTPISSGLGKTKPNTILVVPLIDKLKMMGIIEIESLKPIYPYQIEFVEKIGTTIASTILTVETNVNTSLLLEQSKQQAEELEQQEEEMRQNMEEMKATQEDAKKHESQLQNLISGFHKILPITEYDENGTCLEINDNFLKIINQPKSKIIGKKHKSDEFMDEREQQNHNQFWKDLQQGLNREIVEKYKSGKSKFWIKEYFIPLKNEQNKVERVLCIGIDISNQKRTENELRKIQDDGTNSSKIKNKSKKVNLNAELKVLDLTYLKMVYKKDAVKIYNILNLYQETLSSQILELDGINKKRDFKLLKRNISGLKTKISYMGLKNIYENLRKIERLIVENKNLSEITDIIEIIKKDWATASKELHNLLNQQS